MPLPVIADVTRCTLNWSNGGVGAHTHNVLHFSGQSSDKQAACDAITDGMAGVTNSLASLPSDWGLDSIDFIDLDGTAPTITKVPATALTGGGSGDGILNACCLISLRTNQRGPAHRGRIYLGPIAEGISNDGFNTVANIMTTAWLAILADWGAGDAGSLVVASYTHDEALAVLDVHVDPIVATQRRRLDQLR